jgi:hypothetical protein
VGKDALADKVKPADDSDDDSDEEHLEDHGDTAVLLRELEKNRREGAPADQARPDASAAASRETWPLRRRTRCWASSLPSVKTYLWVGGGATVPGTFAIKHRWVDGACSPWLVLRHPLTFRRRDIQEASLEPEDWIGRNRERATPNRVRS